MSKVPLSSFPAKLFEGIQSIALSCVSELCVYPCVGIATFWNVTPHGLIKKRQLFGEPTLSSRTNKQVKLFWNRSRTS
jgi:hypothetical protein